MKERKKITNKQKNSIDCLSLMPISYHKSSSHATVSRRIQQHPFPINYHLQSLAGCIELQRNEPKQLAPASKSLISLAYWELWFAMVNMHCLLQTSFKTRELFLTAEHVRGFGGFIIYDLKGPRVSSDGRFHGTDFFSVATVSTNAFRYWINP